MTELAEYILHEIRRRDLLLAGERVGVAVSGGIDSVALLRLMLELRGELGIVVSVVHFNHKLRGEESEADERFVAELARGGGLEFYCDGDDVAGHARDQAVSLETAARELRYGFFRHLIREGVPQGLKPHCEVEVNHPATGEPVDESSSLRSDLGRSEARVSQGSSQTVDEMRSFAKLDKILTGHILDDQAETVLMRLIRGAGMRGLGGIHPRIPVEDDDGTICGEIVRPLLGTRRRELEAYLKDLAQPWREDSSNADHKFTRNRIRQLLVPLLEKEFNPSIAESLSELADIARAEEDYWDNEIAGWMGTGLHWSEPEWARNARTAASLVQIGRVSSSEASSRGQRDDLLERIENAPWLVMNASVDRLWFLREPLAVQRRVIRAVGDEANIPLEFKHIEEIVAFGVQDSRSGKELSLPLGWKVRREPDEIVFLTPNLGRGETRGDYEYDLPRVGRVHIPELGSLMELRHVPAGMAAYNPDQLLNPDSLPGRLKVRNWRAGDRFWPPHTKSPKKIKELLQERHVAQPERRLWPVVVSEGELVWMRGFPVPERFRARQDREAWVILETAREGESGKA